MPGMTRDIIIKSGSVASAIAGIIGLFMLFQSFIKDAMEENTKQLTLTITQSAVDLAGMHRDDLEVRLRIKKREIQAYKEADKPVPERLHIEYDAMEDQLKEVKEKWFAH